MRVKFGVLEQTQGLHLHAKFHLNVFIVSASGGQKTPQFWAQHKLADVMLVADSFTNESLLQPMQHLSQSPIEFADITDPLLIASALFSRLVDIMD